MMESGFSIENRESDLTRYFGEAVFNDRMMRTRLSRPTYRSLKSTIEAGTPLNKEIAAEVAVAMKQWAIEKGATHFTHWFMPMTGQTAEKHDAFLDTLADGQVILNFSAKALIKGEPDASSFPSGGIRETSAARGYTAWDCTSPAFIKEGTLYIPTAFYSHTGEVLDKKAPLLRANQALSRQGMRLLRALGNTTSKMIVSTIGPEQEYFLVDKDAYERRPDLVNCGRTLFGARPPRGVELSDHYYGSINPRVLAFMQELDESLWHLGITAKSRHNEVAPTQHELAIIFDPSSVAVDHNMLVMEMMKKIAERHGMVCLLHEKPYAGINGSGKHINWSIATDDGENLLDPGSNPCENTQFLLFLVAAIAAVDRYGDYLTLSVATASNEHRLGSHEAPPAILSVAIGDELQNILDSIRNGQSYTSPDRTCTNLGLDSMSVSTVDTTDRNRTSPFAFTGNRFEFRMCGSSLNIAGPCFIMNTIIAKTLGELADALEVSDDKEATAHALITDIMNAHERVLYMGDNYSEEWPEEAKRRGLSVVADAVEAIMHMKDEEFIALFEEEGVLSPLESVSRCDILLENYAAVVGIECRTALDMLTRQIRPAVIRYIGNIAKGIAASESIGIEQKVSKELLSELTSLLQALSDAHEKLEESYKAAEAETELELKAQAFHDIVFSEMMNLRSYVDACEVLIPSAEWPLPSYSELLRRK